MIVSLGAVCKIILKHKLQKLNTRKDEYNRVTIETRKSDFPKDICCFPLSSKDCRKVNIYFSWGYKNYLLFALSVTWISLILTLGTDYIICLLWETMHFSTTTTSQTEVTPPILPEAWLTYKAEHVGLFSLYYPVIILTRHTLHTL